MITKHPWFGPKQKLGWGWTPVSWEGWTASAVCVVAVIAAQLYWGPSLTAGLVTMGSVTVLLIVCLLTGTRPGGPGL
jgi:hypothetical protein